MKKFKFYSDPSHGWLAVKRQLLIDLKIINQISGYSYQKGKTVYLEEDGDCSTFIIAYKSKYNVKPDIFEKSWTNKQSSIRSYDDFKRVLL